MKDEITLHQSDEGYGVSALGLPGCGSQGITEAEALANIETAIREYLSVAKDLLEDAEVRRRESSARAIPGTCPPTSLSKRVNDGDAVVGLA